ncbi:MULTISPECIES: hypothetical protein [Mycolicibacterium]|uniref:Uncharacterized protein n=1 Tax=Mycolicibacterium senegalense TaxID=1796 RepID=A0A378W7A2_9MYCO|nr:MULTISPECIES: hypothetical protein [Mycolicibacterium]MCV7338178.1 hypothetical protein [Mycolicibacterium senegalense]MDR7287455.1 hypothetical protein [Mycolicibacterium senegalense]QZA24509.1 hypothetical protein K3U95_28670 [Mycolicibacterium senegalense]CDP87378.1 hypothetical protein BN975_03337 [Mycolicibacterium farcinogenes]SUA28967.1 Uncharacterised protein [Mycolicibacterium senegalense]
MTHGWPAGTHHVAYDKLPDVLLDASSQHARLVHELYPGDTSWDAQRVAISIGTAVELLLKHVLALRSFQLLPDNYKIETALTLDGKGSAADHLPQLTTVAGTAAVERLNKASELQLKKEDFELAFRVRNSAIHLGVASTQANKAAFKKMVLVIDSLFSHLGVKTSERIQYWGGEEAEKFVRAIVDEAITEAKARYEQLLRRAKDDYQTLTESLLEAGKAEVIKQFAEVPPTINSGSEEAVSHLCPACANMGWVVYEVHRGTPTVEYLDDQFGGRHGDAYVERKGSADRFECGVCRLKLDRREYLVEAAVTLEIELEPDEATQDEIDEYEADLVDSHIDFMIDVARGK